MTKQFLLALLFSAAAFAQSPWPSVSWNTADNLTAIMNTAGINDLSGLHWNPVTQRLYCVQGDGRLRILQMNASATGFTQIANRTLPDGPEGITQVDFSANEFYTIDENAYEIRKFTHNGSFGNLTESRHWDLLQSPSPMEDTGNTGPEGIVFIPDAALADAGFVSQQTGNLYTSQKGMGGLLFVAHQDEGYIWVFDVNPTVNNDFLYVGKYQTNRLESTDLAFDRTTGMLYILHNIDANYLEVTDLTSLVTTGSSRKFNTISEYFLPNPTDGNSNIEGFALMPKCPDDVQVSVWLARDVETDEGSAILQDCLRWFAPFVADGTCTPPLAIEHPETKIFNVYPNPGNQSVAIDLVDQTEAHVTFINALGQVALHRNAGADLTLDVSVLPAGLYFISVTQNGNSAVVKWVKY